MPRKPDATKGTLTGSVICADTGKPARFAEVQLLPASMFSAHQGSNNDLDLSETADTGLDGRFTIEAVPPGDYYAFATLNGYLDPERGIDFSRADPNAGDGDQIADVLSQWKDHFVPVSVTAQHSSEVSIQIERGSEIDGTVTYDDSTPAIGVRFKLLRKTAEDKWTPVGESKGDWSLGETSDSHGRYRITDLPAGEYKVCAMLPVQSEESAPQICLGDTFRQRNSQAVKVDAGDAAGGADIVIPLTGLFTVAGNITVGADGHSPAQATVRLLYGDDRAMDRSTTIRGDGSFEFQYVPAGNYILQVTNVQDNGGNSARGSDQQAQPAAEVHRYLDKEVPLSVQGEMNDVNITLIEAFPQKSAGP